MKLCISLTRWWRLLVACMVVASLASASAVFALNLAANGALYVPNEYIIRVKPGSSLSTVENAIAQLGGTIVKPVALADTYLIKMGTRSVGKVRASRASATSVATSPWIITDFMPNYIYHAMEEIPNDTAWSDLWGLRMINMPQAWSIEMGGAGVTVAVIDSGVANHPDLAGRVLQGFDFVDNDSDPSNDIMGHGTHVSGIIAAQGNNDMGVVGVCWEGVQILPVRVLDGSINDTSDRVIAGLDYAMNHNADVINMSLGGEPGIRDATFERKLKELALRGIIICAAAGNDATDLGSPAMYDECIAVASVGPTGAIAPYSSYGPGYQVDVAAPGGDFSQGWAAGICSTWVTWNGGVPIFDYQFKQGTSMACPHVAGAAALLLSAGISSDLVRTRLQETARKPASYDRKRMGAGIIDVNAALTNVAIQIVKPAKGSTVSGYPDFKASIRGAVDPMSIKIYLDYVPDSSGLPVNIANETPVLDGARAKEFLNSAQTAISFNWAQISPGQPISAGFHFIYISANKLDDSDTIYDWGTFTVAGRVIPAGQYLFAFPYGLMTTEPGGTPHISVLPSDLLLDASTSQPLDFREQSPDPARLIRWSAAEGYYISYVTGLDNTPTIYDRAWLNPLMPDTTIGLVPTAGGFLPQDRTLSLQFPAGTGFWLLLQKDAVMSDAYPEISATQGFGIYLYKGWNLIGNPYTHDVPLTAVHLTYQGATRTLDQDQLQARPWVDGNFYGYDSRIGYKIVPSDRRLLEPYKGYWIRALVGGISPQESLVITVL